MRELIRQFATYCGVGVVNTAVGLAVILGLSAGLGWHYVPANMGGYACGLAVSFVLNRQITFRASLPAGRAPAQARAFLAVFAAAYTVQLAALYGFVQGLHIAEMPAQVMAIAVYTAIGFLGNRFLAFASDAPTG
jgi:putative flippase GtrA